MYKVLRRFPKHGYLLLSILIFVFLSPLLEKTVIRSYINLFLYSLIFLSTYSVIEKNNTFIKLFPLIGIIINIIIFFVESKIALLILFGLSAIVFTIITFVLLIQIARSKKVNTGLILEAINGYLLIGVVATILNTTVILFYPDAISITDLSNKAGNIIYYSYITLSTIGFGDICPKSPMARNIAVFIGLAGQLYLTIIIAFIIGKISSKTEIEY
ncbi:MAG: hypothetical protein DRI86_02885 [Bacteroidetes bacterium]|nr:MAG: hypothetical protein DRI86_02885 [Bacteroidota bacterium]